MEKISDHPVSLSVSLEGQQQVKRKEKIPSEKENKCIYPRDKRENYLLFSYT